MGGLKYSTGNESFAGDSSLSRYDSTGVCVMNINATVGSSISRKWNHYLNQLHMCVVSEKNQSVIKWIKGVF